MMNTELDPDSLRAAFANFPSGITAVCALDDGEPVGLAASSFVSVSLSPPLVSVCIQQSSSTWPNLRRSRRIGVSVLSSEQQDVCRSLASKTGNRFENVAYHTTCGGAVLIDDATAWLECSLHDVFTAGDHDVAFLRVHGLTASANIRPLVFHASSFHSLAVLVQ